MVSVSVAVTAMIRCCCLRIAESDAMMSWMYWHPALSEAPSLQRLRCGIGSLPLASPRHKGQMLLQSSCGFSRRSAPGKSGGRSQVPGHLPSSNWQEPSLFLHSRAQRLLKELDGVTRRRIFFNFVKRGSSPSREVQKHTRRGVMRGVEVTPPNGHKDRRPVWGLGLAGQHPKQAKGWHASILHPLSREPAEKGCNNRRGFLLLTRSPLPPGPFQGAAMGIATTFGDLNALGVWDFLQGGGGEGV